MMAAGVLRVGIVITLTREQFGRVLRTTQVTAETTGMLTAKLKR
jgi:hypothetical protein